MGKRLDLLKQISHGLAVHFGSNCEIVIHDLTKREIEHSIVSQAARLATDLHALFLRH